MTGGLVLPGAVSETALALPDGLTFDEWAQVGEALGTMDRASAWWTGDWINAGERHYGESYAQALDRTKLDYQTLANRAWVASRVEFSRRRENLSWGHHEVVAALGPAEQDTWLDRAEVEGWSVHELRRAIKAPLLLEAPVPAEGEYATVIIDPPWPMEKIERDVRPNQAAPLDYRSPPTHAHASSTGRTCRSPRPSTFVASTGTTGAISERRPERCSAPRRTTRTPTSTPARTGVADAATRSSIPASMFVSRTVTRTRGAHRPAPR